MALRNSFAHNFGLTNPQEPRHRFRVVCSDSHPLVRLPAEAWNGKYGADSTGGETVVNLQAVGDLMEEYYSEFQRAAEADELVLANGLAADALSEAFGLWIGAGGRQVHSETGSCLAWSARMGVAGLLPVGVAPIGVRSGRVADAVVVRAWWGCPLTARPGVDGLFGLVPL